MKQKEYDFGQIKGDFISMVEMEQYQRGNADKDLCSSIFVSLHMGYQIVLWELTNFPKIKMKMLWFYVMSENL